MVLRHAGRARALPAEAAPVQLRRVRHALRRRGVQPADHPQESAGQWRTLPIRIANRVNHESSSFGNTFGHVSVKAEIFQVPANCLVICFAKFTLPENQ